MSDTPRTIDREPPRAEAKRTLWPGLVWAVPIAALLVVAYLGLRALSDRGVDVVVTFPSAAGAKPGDTKVIYQGLEAGRVTKVDLNRDGRRVDMTLRLIPRARAALDTATKFWIVGAKPNLSDIASVKAALAGVTIGMAPGHGGVPTRHFIGLEQAPVIEPGTAGSSYILTARTLGSVRAGAAVLYHGQQIGKITATRFAGMNSFRIDIFIDAPYDRLIRPGALFWTSSPLSVSLNGAGLSTSLAPADTVFSGAVDFDLPPAALSAKPSAPGSTFFLYKDKGAADQDLSGPEVPYTVYFKGAAGDLAPGAAVKLSGFQVGEVDAVDLLFDGDGRPLTRARAEIFSHRFDLDGGGRAQLDARISHLLQLGYRATLTQSPPLIGGRGVSLQPGKGTGPARLGPADAEGVPVLPSEMSGSDVDDIMSQADLILRKVNQVPIAAIGEDVRQITGRLRTLVGSPQLTDSLNHLDSTLGQVDEMMHQVQPQVGPLIAKLNQTADGLNGTIRAADGLLGGEGAQGDASLPAAISQLTDAARSIRSLADYLGRHPEALLKGKVKDTQR